MDTPSAMETLWTSVSESATHVISLVGDVAGKIVQTPILLLTTGFLVVGGAVGIFGRMLSKR